MTPKGNITCVSTERIKVTHFKRFLRFHLYSSHVKGQREANDLEMCVFYIASPGLFIPI